MRIARDRLEDMAIADDAIRERVFLQERTVLGRQNAGLEMRLGGFGDAGEPAILTLPKGAVDIEHDPRMLLDDAAPDHHAVVDRKKARLGEIAPRLGGAIGKDIMTFGA